MDVNTIRPNPSPSASVASLRSRAESETDYEEIFAPRPRHSYSPTWLREFDDIATAAEEPIRVSSPLNPNRHARKPPIPTIPSSPSSNAHPSMLNHQRNSRLDAFVPSSLHDTRMESPARRWVRWMVRIHMRDWVMPLSIASAVWVKWTTGLGGYSGHGTPPMYGDYEAQRHWMEITTHLPLREWYLYDLPYWGLDYPPLTAYVSYVCGLAAHIINPAWVALGRSRGYEDPESKVFMRSSVLALDLLVYIPAVIWFTRTWWTSRSRRTQNIALLTILLQPSLILIDNGHFQYNSVMLGLTVLSLNFFNSGQDVLGAITFVLSLCFKQMALYYSPTIFAYLLGRCISLPPARGAFHLAKIGLATVLSFLLLFSPFIFQSFPTLFVQSLVRIFPFNRGLFEDKVANFWCATNVLFKWRGFFSAEALPKLATLMTLLAILPPVVHVLAISWSLRDVAGSHRADSSSVAKVIDDSPTSTGAIPPNQPKLHVWPQPAPALSSIHPPTQGGPSPTVTLLLHALFNTSMAFFLFSFQVHEKSILLPLLPLTLLMSGRSDIDVDSGTWEWGVLINNIALFSMWPLLKKDGLGLQYGTLAFLWNYVIGYNPISLPTSIVKYLSMAAYLAMAVLHTGEMFILPPARYPDLFPVLNVLLCSGIFGLGWLWGLKKQMEAGWAISGLHSTASKKPQVARIGNSRGGLELSPTSNRRFTVDARVTGGLRVEENGLRSRKRESIPASMFLNTGNGNAR